jgi:hypothetical protein
MRLRRESYEPGDSRDVNISIEKFLGRRRSLEPLLRQLGVGAWDVSDRQPNRARSGERDSWLPTPRAEAVTSHRWF